MKPTAATVLAQAKINLSLRILAREATGYHQLETLLCRIDLSDRVTLHTEPDVRELTASGPMIPPAGLGPVEQNLAWRAAVAYQAEAGWPSGFRIHLEKNIPVGGGLGGGSADAGATLRILNRLSPEPLSADRLLRVAGALGADVPFLTQDASPLALAWGRGDRVMTLPPLPSRGCVLFAFPFGVDTASAYSWLREEPQRDTSPLLLSPADLAYWEGVDERSANDFERVVLPRYPALSTAMKELARGPGLVPRMSGSGSTLFVLGPTQSFFPARLLAIESERPGEVLPLATMTSEFVHPVEIVQ